ncbi:MAG: 3-hydroxyanthranilate 3,4-dioxygenase, partial [Cognaticolwellia sp.]
MANFAMPFNLQQWVDEHRELLKPPVCNKQIFQQDDYIVMVVGGPNNRQDFHYNETPELFYQLEGEMVLSIVENPVEDCYPRDTTNNKQSTPTLTFRDIAIKAGEIFLLPPKVLHSPQRFEHSVGLVVEQKRTSKQQDALFWFCSQCKNPLYHEQFNLENIEQDLPVVFNNFYNNHSNCQCQKCGHIAKKS